MKRLLFLVMLVMLFVLIIPVSANANPTGVTGYVTNKKKVIIYVGDSRAMQMGYLRRSKRKNYVFVYSNGGSLSCIKHGGGSRWIGNLLQRTLKKYPKAPVVFALGVNGNGNPAKNVKRTSYYKYYMKHYPSHDYYISTVGGTGTSATGNYKNSKVRSFNRRLKKKYKDNKKVCVYDCYQFLVESKLLNPGKSNKGTRDGLHYENRVYAKILKDCRKFIQGCS